MNNVSKILESYTNSNLKIIRKEIEFLPVAEFRKSLIGIFQQLDRSDERQNAIAERIWSIISKLLTSASTFEAILPDATEQIFISPKTVKENWGYEISANYDRAISIAYSLIGVPNPIFQELVKYVKSLIHNRQTFTIIYPKQWIEELSDRFKIEGIDKSYINIISSVSDYRDCEYVDTIIKIGPMRKQGWSRTPDSLLTSPKCKTIIQIAWEKTPDESTHGYDPIVPVSRLQLGRIKSQIVDWEVDIQPVIIEWNNPIPPPTIECSGIILSDELTTLSVTSREIRSAVLLSLDSCYGFLSAPAGKIIVFNPGQTADTCCNVKSAATIEPGSFIVIIGDYTIDTDIDGTTGLDNYSQTWKAKLEKESELAPIAFIQNLEKNGLDLSELRSAIRHWVQPTSTVIHAPQRCRHFEIICRLLGLDYPVNFRGKQIPFWRAAWNEITISRGEAIQAGMQNSERVETAVLDGLSKLNETLNLETNNQKKVIIKIPFGEEGGYLPVTLYKILEIESGYRAPDCELRKILQLDYIQQWQ
jgi:hypothetical protein